MTTYNSSLVVNKQPPSGGHGDYQNSTHMHASVAVNALAANDVINMFPLPRNALVTGLTLKADSQLDSNGSPTLTFDVGITGTTQLFMAASALVGRAAGASFDTTMAAGGKLYKNLTGADLPVFVTAHASAATGVAGTLELEMNYFVEDVVGSPA
jgi:hypothetical protein